MTQPFQHLRQFMAELKRRNVYKVAVTYAIVSFVVWQAASLLFPALDFPGWTIDFVIVLTLLGFPLALVVAWAFEMTPDGVRRTPGEPEPAPREPGGPAGPTEAPGPARSWPAATAITVLAVLLAAAAFLLVRSRLEETEERTRRSRLEEIERLADQGRYLPAYRLALDVEGSPDADTVLDTLWPRISDRLTVTTEPSGARVLSRRLASAGGPADSATGPSGGTGSGGGTTESVTGSELTGPAEDSAFGVLGTTPVERTRIPRAPHLLRIEKEGFAPAERLASSALVRAEGPLSPEDQIVIEAQLVREEESPDRMVFVPGGRYELVTPDLPAGLTARLDGYFIDRYEVTNARFREFVTSGGYSTRAYWPSPLVVDGDTVELEATRERFVDRTDLPAPRGWTGQDYPDGRGEHPVTGVSWYEAAAYCAFRDKRLPTVFQWEKAARDGRTTHFGGIVMPWGLVTPGDRPRRRANFSGSGTEPVDARPFGISPFGAYAMAGNVKEWTANPIGARRTVTGGSWRDPLYVFSEFGAFDPGFASGSLGFRCARVRADDARRLRDQGSIAIEIDERTPTYEPVDEETFRSLLAHYRYDRRDLEPQVLDTVETPDWTRQKLSYEAPRGGRVLAYLWLPKSTAPPHQTMVYVGSGAVFAGVTLPEETERYLGPLARSGRAIFAVVLKGMAEREWGPGYEEPDPSTVRFREQMVRHATELRLGLDYLETRDDIDMDRLAYVAFSFGAGSRLGFAAVDDRYDAVVLIGGGIDERLKPTLPAADNVNFAPYIEPPKLLLNGRHDEEHPWFSRALPLWNLLREPKELVLAEGAGHMPPPEVRIPAIRSFLDTIFGPVRGGTGR